MKRDWGQVLPSSKLRRRVPWVREVGEAGLENAMIPGLDGEGHAMRKIEPWQVGSGRLGSRVAGVKVLPPSRLVAVSRLLAGA